MDRPRIELPINRAADFENIIRHINDGYLVIVPTTQSIWGKIPSSYHRYIFREEELKYCPLDHERVPRHRLATQEEIDNLPRGELPVIYTHDIICRWLGFQVNDIIAIERKSIYYRRII